MYSVPLIILIGELYQHQITSTQTVCRLKLRGEIIVFLHQPNAHVHEHHPVKNLWMHKASTFVFLRMSRSAWLFLIRNSRWRAMVVSPPRIATNLSTLSTSFLSLSLCDALKKKQQQQLLDYKESTSFFGGRAVLFFITVVSLHC